MAEPFTIYKITILYMLDKVDFPLSNTQISNFFLEKDYTDYFRVQEVLSDLEDTGLILAKASHSNTQYTLLPEGRKTLAFFRDKITDGISCDVADYFAANSLSMRTENSVIADYYRSTDGRYAARCRVLSDQTPVVDLTLSVATKEQAKSVCANWKTQNEDVYSYLMDTLMK